MRFKPYFTRLSQTIGTWLSCYCFSWSFFLFCRFMGCCCCFCGLGWSCGRLLLSGANRRPQSELKMKAQQSLAGLSPPLAAAPRPAQSSLSLDLLLSPSSYSLGRRAEVGSRCVEELLVHSRLIAGELVCAL